MASIILSPRTTTWKNSGKNFGENTNKTRLTSTASPRRLYSNQKAMTRAPEFVASVYMRSECDRTPPLRVSRHTMQKAKYNCVHMCIYGKWMNGCVIHIVPYVWFIQFPYIYICTQLYFGCIHLTWLCHTYRAICMQVYTCNPNVESGHIRYVCKIRGNRIHIRIACIHLEGGDKIPPSKSV